MVFRNGLAWLECARFSRLKWLAHAFNTRQGGVSQAPAAGLNLGFTESDQRRRVEQNRLRFFAELDVGHFTLASLHQIHSQRVHVVTRSADWPRYSARRGAEAKLAYRPCDISPPVPLPETPPAGDALLTDQAGILLSVRVADCLPVLIVDPQRRAVAAVHAGWRGALARVIERAATELCHTFGSRPEHLLAALGPSIRSCCYEVGEEVVEAFYGQFPRADGLFRRVPRPGRHGVQARPWAFLDLVAVALVQLRAAGLSARQASVADYCTACRTDLFYSYRKEGARTGRTMAVIGIRPKSGSKGFGGRS